MIKVFIYFLQSLIIYFFYICAKLIGITNSRKIFGYLFLKIAPFFKSKKIISKNLKIFEKDMSEEKKDMIINCMWKNYGMTFAEYIFLDRFRKGNSYVEVIGKEHIEKINRNNKPVIFVSGHFANFELMSMEITKSNFNLATIYRPLNNFFLNPFMEFLRRKYVCKNQIKKGISGVREAIEYIKNDFSIALMIDQRVSEGELIDFFGKPALTTTLPAQLAIKYNLSIIPVFIERSKDLNFKIYFNEEIKASDYKDKIELSKKLNLLLEEMIRKNPYEWIWTHNRWK